MEAEEAVEEIKDIETVESEIEHPTTPSPKIEIDEGVSGGIGG